MRPAIAVQFDAVTRGDARDARADLLTLLRDRSLREGDFVLSSGEPSDWYIDAKQTTLTGDGALATGRAYFAEAERLGATAIGGAAVGHPPPAPAPPLVSGLRGLPLAPFL